MSPTTAKAQIFQTNSPSRWKRIKWTGRIVFFILLFVIAVVAIAYIVNKDPNSNVEAGKYSSSKDVSILLPDHYKKIKGFKKFLEDKQKEDSIRKQSQNINKATGQFIRGAFYTPWSGSKSTPSLEKYGDKLNVIFPEWFFIDTVNNGRIQSRIDSYGLVQMRQKNLRIMPMLTNYNSSKGDFDGTLIHSILNDTLKQQKFIQQLVDSLSFYHFQGINVDFEELIEATNKPLTDFQRRLYSALHEKGLTVTQDVEAMNDSYDFEHLAEYNDYIILMAYDQFSNKASGPGPISEQKWIENALDQAAKKMESNKIILGLAGYGYDWQTWEEEGEKQQAVSDITYVQAMDNAKVSNSVIDFNNDNYNLHYSFTQKLYSSNSPAIKHDVWFTDAATTFNIMRFADEYGLAGTALWRLGSEDPRIWSFYNLDLDNASLSKKPFDFNLLSTIPINPNRKPSWVGQEGGEILNILSTPQEGKIQLEVDSSEQLISEQVYTQMPSGYVYEKTGEDTTPIGPGHKIILTFDDGPSEEYTPKILDILEKEKVPAAFFIVGL